MTPGGDDIRIVISGAAEDLRRAARSAVRAIKDVSQEARRANTESRVTEGQNLRTARSFDVLSKKQAGATQSLRNFSVGLRAIAWTTAIANTAPLAAGLVDIAAGATAAGAALAPLAGSVAALPGLFAAGAQAVAVFSLATHGMGEAMAGNQKALEKLTPAARDFIKTLRDDFGPEIRKLQATAQAGLFPGLLKGLKAAEPALRPLNKIVGDTAKQLGSLGAEFGRMVGSKAWTKDLATLGDRNVKVIGHFGDAGLRLADALRNVVLAAGPLVDWMSRAAEATATNIDKWTKAARANGNLADFFKLVRERISQTVAILVNLGTTFGHVLGAAQPLADALMRSLVGVTGHLAQITGTTSGQNNLRKFFDDARGPLEAVGKLLGALVAAIFDLAAKGQADLKQLADTLRVDVLPVLHDALAAIATQILPKVISLLGSVGQLLHAILPGLKPILAALGTMLDLLKGIVDELTKITDALPGVAKLIPTLAVGAGVLASWRTLVALSRAVVFGTAAGGAASGAAGFAGGAAAGAAGASGARTLSAARNVERIVGGGVTGAGAGFFARGGLKGAAIRVLPKVASKAPIIGAGVATAEALGFPDQAGIAKINQNVQVMVANATKGKTGIREFTRALERLADKEHQLAFEATPAAAKKLHETEDALRGLAAPTRDVINAIDKLKGATVGDMGTIATSVRLNMRLIARSMKDGSAEATQALSQNFLAGVSAIRRSMAAGEISTKEGLAKIAAYFRKDLALYGITGKQASRYIAGNDTLTGKSLTGGATAGKATGGFIGSPGEAGGDNIPVVLGRGEAVLNRHQQAPVNAALQAVYGTDLGGVFSNVTRPHYMAKGGFAGMVAKANEIDSHHYKYLWGGGHDQGFSAPYDCSGAVSAVLHAGGVLNAPRVSGGFEGYGKAGPGKVTLFANNGHVYMRLGNRYFGTSGANPGGGAGWFPGAPRAGFAVRHVDAGAGADIRTPKMPSGLGLVGAIGQAGLGAVTKAANSALSGAAFGGATGGGDPAEKGGGGRFGFDALKALWIRAGGPAGAAAIMAHVALAESGGDPGAHNPSGATGLWQILGAVRPGNLRDPLVNARNAVAKYKAGGLGPWAASRGTWGKYLGQRLARGGFVGQRMAGGGYPTASASSVSDTLYGLGDPTAPKKGSKKKAKKGPKPITKLNQGTGHIETHSPSVWRKITNAQAKKRWIKSHMPSLKVNRGSGSTGGGAPKNGLPHYTPDDSNVVGAADLTFNEQAFLDFFDGQLAMADFDTPFLPYDPTNTNDSPFDPATPGTFIHDPGRLDDDLLWAGRKEFLLGNIYQDRKTRGAPVPIQGRIATMLKAAHDDLVALQALHDAKQERPPPDTSARDAALAQLTGQQRDDALRNLNLSRQQYGIFKGMAPLVGARLVGSFAHGTMRVPQTGLALLHKDEMVIPDREGPYGNAITAPNVTSSPQIDISVNVDHRGMVQSVEAMVDGKIHRAQVDQGRRARLLTGVGVPR